MKTYTAVLYRIEKKKLPVSIDAKDEADAMEKFNDMFEYLNFNLVKSEDTEEYIENLSLDN